MRKSGARDTGTTRTRPTHGGLYIPPLRGFGWTPNWGMMPRGGNHRERGARVR